MSPQRKLTGAAAELFAAICLHYIEAAESECNDRPQEVPLFSNLSPHQRIQLVSDVCVGVLCESEPLPPDTIQHNATYRAVIETLLTELLVEIDTQGDHEIGDDLWLLSDETKSNYRTPEEIAEYEIERQLIEAKSVYNKKKMQDRVEEGRDWEKFQVTPTSTFDADKYDAKITGIMSQLYAGPPVSKQQRQSMRSLSDEERYAFRWRRLCDAALQEDQSFPFALHSVDFDWRCMDLTKWCGALNLLLHTYMFVYSSPTEQAIVYGKINELTYADKANIPRIREVERQVEVLRKVYDHKWKREELALSQRRVFAICSQEAYGAAAHQPWVKGFTMRLRTSKGIDFFSTGNYQARLDVFRELNQDPKYRDGLDKGYHHSDYPANSFDDTPPSEFDQTEDFLSFTGFFVHCQGVKKPSEFGVTACLETENLKACIQCQVAAYCSRTCQKSHWSEHKKVCKQLAERRNDKEDMQHILSKFRN